jgi:hypothetical protein
LMYTAKKEVFNPSYISNIFIILKNFNNGVNPSRNSFAIDICDPYDFPWENWLNRRIPWRKEERFENYVEREGMHIHVPPRESIDKWEDRAFWYFSLKVRKVWRMMYEGFLHPFSHPTSSEIMCLNMEELASIYHFPGATASIPTLPRIDSAKSLPPTNLPQ